MNLTAVCSVEFTMSCACRSNPIQSNNPRPSCDEVLLDGPRRMAFHVLRQKLEACATKDEQDDSMEQLSRIVETVLEETREERESFTRRIVENAVKERAEVLLAEMAAKVKVGLEELK